MHRSITPILLSCGLLFACSTDSKPNAKEREQKQSPFLINMQHFFNENENELSFPNWFDDSMIVYNGIHSITRRIFRSSENEEENLKEVRKYLFNQSGNLEELEVTEYYDGRIVGSLRVNYLTDPDEYGYAPLKITEYTGNDIDESHYHIYEKEEYARKYLAYRNLSSNDYLFFLLDKAYWGVLSVDSILNPTPYDMIIYGKPQHPLKKFKIENKVKESYVVEYSYNDKYGFVTKMTSDNYPFRNKRNFIYDKRGNFSYFVDSTYSDESFLTRSLMKMETNDSLLPVQVSHEHFIEGELKGFTEHEKFEYEFYKK